MSPTWRHGSAGQLPVPYSLLRSQSIYLRCKPVVDCLFALVLLALTAPIILLAALIVRLTSRGPAFYSQTRLGRNSRPYTIYKIRTMAHDCERVGGPRWATTHDPRVTRVGRLLRCTHIDELPQLWNVLRGDMSLIGPRPERPEFITLLEQSVPHYKDRLQIRPGLTGLAQVQLPADTDLASVRRKLAYDLYYLEHMGLWLDFRIFLSTALYLIGIAYHKVPKPLRVPNGEVVEWAYEARVIHIQDVVRVQPA